MSSEKYSSSSVHLALKARVVENLEVMEERIFNFTQSIGQVACQSDVYFQVSTGQMKLRLTSASKNCDIGQLITSKTIPGSNLIETQSSEVSELRNMKRTLGLSLPELGTIKKRRRVCVKDNIRINLDDVDQMGCFVDIEIQGVDEIKRQEQAELVKRELGITDNQIVNATYMELYRKLKSVDSGVEDDESIDG